MKYIVMEAYFSIALVCIQMLYVSTSEYNPIIQQISRERICNEDKLFGQFSLSTVTQFGALCNIEVPKIEAATFLLENNVVPILCMGLYDVSLRSCKAAYNNTSPFAEIFPPSVNKFNELFTSTLERSDNFSSLTIFCEDTVKLYAINDSANNVTKVWWTLLNKELNDTKKCASICRTNEEGRVHPLCSYIVWSNAIFIKHLKSQAESVDLLSPSSVPATDSNITDVPPIKVDQENENTAVNPTRYGSEIIRHDQPGNIAEPNNVDDVPIKPTKEAAPLTNVIKVAHQSSSYSTNKNQPVKVADAEIAFSKIDKEVEKEKLENVIQQNNLTGMSKNTTKIQDVNTVSDDHTDDMTFAGAPEEQQQIPSVKEGQFSEEDEDGDDVDTPEDSLKTSAKKDEFNRGGLFQSNAKDVESDKVYGNEEVMMEDHFIETEDPHFITYFLCLTVLVILFYLAFYNKKKLVALAVEGRRSRNSRRRPNCSNYSKLNCNLEEALVSKTTASVTHVLY